MKTDETNYVKNRLPPPRQVGTPTLEAIRATQAEDQGARETDAFDRWRNAWEKSPVPGDRQGGPDDAYRQASRAKPEEEEETPHGGLADIASIHGLDPSELTAPVGRVLGEMTQELSTLNEALQAAARRIDRLEHESEHDSLTGLMDRGGLMHEIAHVRSLDLREQGESTLALIDLVEAPEIRRRHGRPAMESLLRTVAERLADTCESGELLAHLGEGEFALILPGRPPDDARARLGAVLERALADPFRHGGQDHALSAMVGLASAATGEEADAVLAAADMDLRRAG
jgi:diguanylate cyclase (GGDEF)-like protein